jgi:hypothetical protein
MLFGESLPFPRQNNHSGLTGKLRLLEISLVLGGVERKRAGELASSLCY